jgi:hypothetical protein
MEKKLKEKQEKQGRKLYTCLEFLNSEIKRWENAESAN